MHEKSDGRHARSNRTRIAVAEAMLDCLEEGMLRASAKEVAERAGVSSRAVFRHFENMESLFEEASQIQIERVMSALPPVLGEGTLDQRVDSLVRYAAHCHEVIAPVRRAALLSEPFSKVIQERHAWLRSLFRKHVREVFATEWDALSVPQRRDRIALLRAMFSFSYWEELRRHEKLSTAAASRVLCNAVQAVLRQRE